MRTPNEYIAAPRSKRIRRVRRSETDAPRGGGNLSESYFVTGNRNDSNYSETTSFNVRIVRNIARVLVRFARTRDRQLSRTTLLTSKRLPTGYQLISAEHTTTVFGKDFPTTADRRECDFDGDNPEVFDRWWGGGGDSVFAQELDRQKN